MPIILDFHDVYSTIKVAVMHKIYVRLKTIFVQRWQKTRKLSTSRKEIRTGLRDIKTLWYKTLLEEIYFSMPSLHCWKEKVLAYTYYLQSYQIHFIIPTSNINVMSDVMFSVTSVLHNVI